MTGRDPARRNDLARGAAITPAPGGVRQPRQAGAVADARNRRRNGRRRGTVVCCTKDAPPCPAGHEPFPNGYTCHLPDEPYHGKPGGYSNHLCRCPACTTAWIAYKPPSRDGYRPPSRRKGARRKTPSPD
jgi:hypothetical protein